MYAIKNFFLSEEQNKNNFLTIFKSYFQNIKNIFFKWVSKKQDPCIFLIGRDGVNWSIDKDRKHIEYFLEINNIKISKNLYKSTQIFCVSAWITN